MKKLLLIAFVFAATAFAARAQTEKGKWLVGGSVEIGSETEDDPNEVYKTKINLFNVNPEVGYFIMDDLALGLMIQFHNSSYNSNNEPDKTKGFFVGPSLRYYLPLTERFKFIGELQIPIGSSKYEPFGGVVKKTQSMGVNLKPGFAFFPYSKVSLEFGLGRIYFSAIKTGEVKRNIIGINTGNVDVGFKFHLGK